MEVSKELRHRHHIIPRHAGGTDDPSNIVYLTPAEHAAAHRRLYEQYGRWQDKVAADGLSGIIGHEEAVRQASINGPKGRKPSEKQLAAMRRPKSPEHVAKVAAAKRGVKRTPEQRARMSAAMKAAPRKPKSKEHLDKIRAFASKPKSPETKAKMSEARRKYWRKKHESSIV